VLFAVLGALFALMQWRKIGTFALRNVLAWLAALVGLALVFSMSQIYMIPTQPAWDTIATPIFFFTTTFLLGMLTMGAAFVANYAYLRRKGEAGLETQMALLREVLQGIAVGSLLLLGVEVVLLPVFVTYLATYSPVTQASAEMLFDDYLPIFILRLVLIFLGAGIFAAFLFRSATAKSAERTLSNLVYAAFGLVLVAEVLGRFLFYATQVGVGL
jgi:anaerobic dimethyl sulfoxide reductase subunit C (anchor subunit)